ncbi:MAG: hypothetical protein Q8S73_21270, partial [Deltaproteobacteria bacterium]|nr:hypothetical protein [Deltaproteobacteria bacterium]
RRPLGISQSLKVEGTTIANAPTRDQPTLNLRPQRSAPPPASSRPVPAPRDPRDPLIPLPF